MNPPYDDMTVQGRVSRGVAWLNDTKPGWQKNLNVDALDLTDSEACVLGQVFANDCGNSMDLRRWRVRYNGYTWALHVTEWSPRKMAEHGFLPLSNFAHAEEYRLLHREWEKYLGVGDSMPAYFTEREDA